MVPYFCAALDTSLVFVGPELTARRPPRCAI